MLETLAFQGLVGLSLGMYIWLVAAGLTLIFGVLGVLNFAHGSLYMLGAYCTFTLLGIFKQNFWLAVVVGPALVALVGLVMERFFIRHVYRLEVAYQLLLTFGFVLILDDLVKMIWGPIYMVPSLPRGFEGAVWMFGRPFPVYNLFVISVGPVVALVLWLALDHTWWGRMVRAAASDREMASAIGINVPRVFTSVFLVGSWLGALGGALGIPVRAISPGMGTFFIIYAFVVAVIGGLGSMRGAFVGAVLIGLLNSYGVLFIPVFEMALVFILMAIVLIMHPQGIFGGR